ncbi:MAG: type I DNA topoisomerase [Peptoniphilaceae bacterium]|nr:type I DNA topoisomerase [Peptoniphilaceae bacterium]MDY3076034.1 type I DNA topoisomerase [Peptoniphilaceae bacterium]
MAKNLLIVESPTKTKTISKILGKNYRVLASKGHLRDLPKSQFGVDIEHGFTPKYINVRGKAKTINELKKAASESDCIYLATDPDREGEAISWHLAQILNLDPQKSLRVTFHEITPEGVKQGIQQPRAIDTNLVDAQQARRIMDRIVGYQISPLLWKRIHSGLSAGRVQSAALKLIIDREREIQAFIPEEYWSIHSLHSKNRKRFETEFQGFWNGTKIEKVPLGTEEDADRIVKGLDDVFKVFRIQTKKRTKKPYAPFTTSTLQQEASRKLGFSTSKTMSVAQQLYEGVHLSGEGGQVGLITYMRTDSTRLSDSFIGQAKSFITKNYGSEFASVGLHYGGKNANTQDAHEGIRPSETLRTPQSIANDLTTDQQRLYDLIWRRAIASQMTASVDLQTTVDLINRNYIFRSTGSHPEFDGFQRVWPIREKEVILPELKEGEELKAIKVEKKQHFTQPPARYTEASLVSTLEKNGIGRPSTYSSIIRSILTRRYVTLEKKQFHPTDLGNQVNSLLEANFSDIINEKFTASMEKRLDDVARGEVSWQALMQEFYERFEQDLKKAKEDDASYRVEEKKTGEACPNCGGDLVYKHGRNGDFIGCSNFPECTYTKSIVKSTGVKCPRCGGEIVEKVSKRGKVFYGCSNYPKCDYASWDPPTGEICPVCGDLMVHRKNRFENRVLCHNEACPTNQSDQKA